LVLGERGCEGGGDLLAKRAKGEKRGERYRAEHEGGFCAKEFREKKEGVFKEERTKEKERQTD